MKKLLPICLVALMLPGFAFAGDRPGYESGTVYGSTGVPVGSGDAHGVFHDGNGYTVGYEGKNGTLHDGEGIPSGKIDSLTNTIRDGNGMTVGTMQTDDGKTTFSDGTGYPIGYLDRFGNVHDGNGYTVGSVPVGDKIGAWGLLHHKV